MDGGTDAGAIAKEVAAHASTHCVSSFRLFRQRRTADEREHTQRDRLRSGLAGRRLRCSGPPAGRGAPGRLRAPQRGQRLLDPPCARLGLLCAFDSAHLLPFAPVGQASTRTPGRTAGRRDGSVPRGHRAAHGRRGDDGLPSLADRVRSPASTITDGHRDLRVRDPRGGRARPRAPRGRPRRLREALLTGDCSRQS
jgi:hypothetical protein